MFARGGDFSRQQRAYDSLIASGGQLKAGTNSRPQPPAVPTPAEEEPEALVPTSP
jgi:hypothetical protein